MYDSDMPPDPSRVRSGLHQVAGGMAPDHVQLVAAIVESIRAQGCLGCDYKADLERLRGDVTTGFNQVNTTLKEFSARFGDGDKRFIEFEFRTRALEEGQAEWKRSLSTLHELAGALKSTQEAVASMKPAGEKKDKGLKLWQALLLGGITAVGGSVGLGAASGGLRALLGDQQQITQQPQPPKSTP